MDEKRSSLNSTYGNALGHHPVPSTKKHILQVFFSISRLHITSVAALGAFTFGWLFTNDYPWFLTVVCALDWYLVNLFNVTVDLDEDRANAIVGTDLIVRSRAPIIGIGLGILVVSFVVVHLLCPAITGLRMAFHMLGACYNWPILPGKRRLKKTYFWKNNASAFGFLLTVFGYPLASLGYEKGFQALPPDITWATVVFAATFFFLFELGYELIYDLRDKRGDALAGVRTYAVVHGERTAVLILDGLILSSMAVLAMGYVLAFVPWRIFIMIGAPLPLFIIYKRALRRGVSAKDCIVITWVTVVMLIIYHIWVVAELPGVGL